MSPATAGPAPDPGGDEIDRLRAEIARLGALAVEGERAAEALRLAEERHRALVQLGSEGVWRFELDEPIPLDLPEPDVVDRIFAHGYLAECNDAMARMYGFERGADIIGARLGMLDRSDPKNVEYLRAFVRSGHRLTGAESHELDRNGGSRTFLNDLIGVVEEGRLVRAWGTQVDVTDRRRLEEDLRQAQKMEAVGRLAAGVAHDFNNLLTAILGHADMAEERLPADAPARADLRDIRISAHRASGLTQQLLAFARRQVAQPVLLDLNDLVFRLDRLLARLLREDIQLVTSAGPALWPVRVDPGQMEQVVINLAINARDAMPAGGVITLSTGNVELAEPGGGVVQHVMLSVQDSGLGMDEETRRKVFEPYFTTKEIGQGTGLGLATCHGIIAQSGGRIEVESHPSHGTTFRVLLPRAHGDSTPLPDLDAEPDLPQGDETILLVEDEPALRALATRMLERQGYLVLAASTPTEALQRAGKHAGAIDLLLTDVVLPRMNGLELARRIGESRPDARVLLMSGYPGNAVLDSSFDDRPFLRKPFTRAQLALAVRHAIDADR